MKRYSTQYDTLLFLQTSTTLDFSASSCKLVIVDNIRLVNNFANFRRLQYFSFPGCGGDLRQPWVEDFGHCTDVYGRLEELWTQRQPAIMVKVWWRPEQLVPTKVEVQKKFTLWEYFSLPVDRSTSSPINTGIFIVGLTYRMRNIVTELQNEKC